jgi:FtsP/CotA-like multicopper oxidase with cupredoxin domain
MKNQSSSSRNISRRDFLKMAGGAVFLVAGASVMPQFLRKTLLPTSVAGATDVAPDLFLAGTDGWISLPASPAIGVYHPDALAPSPFTTYIFGFRNVTGLTDVQRDAQKNKAQHNAPLFWVNQVDPAAANPAPFRLNLTNLGLAQRPDLTDSHTLHWHGFRNVIPFFDGEPTGSVSVPVGRIFTYAYVARDPGTYMYHCHVEDVEHVHMGMTGLVFVRPFQDNGNPALGIPASRYGGNLSSSAPAGYAYNDGVQPFTAGSTAFHREFAMFLSEVWAEAHYDDAHIQLPDWTDYHVDFALLNGRVYPDTLAPNGSIDPFNPVRDADGDLIAPDGRPDLQYQPLSALVNCNAGERVLLRFANLGFREASMTLTGIPMHVVGKDATPMFGGVDGAGPNGADTSYDTDTLLIGAGESFDVIFKAPPHTGAGYDTYYLYNRRYSQDDNLAGDSGQRTEIRVYASGALPAQAFPNG